MVLNSGADAAVEDWQSDSGISMERPLDGGVQEEFSYDGDSQFEGPNHMARKCKQCKNPYIPTAQSRSTQKFCSASCKQRYYYHNASTGQKKKRLAYARERYKTLTPEQLKNLKKGQKKQAQRVRRTVSAYKQKVGCVDCGYNKHACALDFDHVTGEKKFAISRMRSLAKVQAEMQKCEVVCANCHRVRTLMRHRRKHAEAKNRDGEIQSVHST
jgi:hypothetical protein